MYKEVLESCFELLKLVLPFFAFVAGFNPTEMNSQTIFPRNVFLLQGLRDVLFAGGLALIERLQNDGLLKANKSAVSGLSDMKLLLEYLQAFEVIDKVNFDLAS